MAGGSPGPDTDTPAGNAFGRWPVRRYLLLVVVVAVAGLAAATAYGYVWSAGQARDDARARMGLQAGRAAAGIATSVDALKQTVADLASQPGLEGVFGSGDACQLTADGTQTFPSVRLDIVASSGRIGCSSDPEATEAGGRVHAGASWLSDSPSPPDAVVDWEGTDAANGQAAAVVSASFGGTDEPAGVVAAFLHLPEAGRAIASNYALTQGATFSLVERSNGRVVTTSETRDPEAGRFGGSARSGEWTGLDASRRLYGSSDVAGSPLRVYAGVRSSTVLDEIQGSLTRQLLLGAVVLLILVVAVVVLNRRVAAPLRAITSTVVRAGRDADRQRAVEAGTAEIAALAREFNRMLDLRVGHEAQLTHQATHDTLTGLPNRALLTEQLATLLRRERVDGVTVVWIGLERLSLITETYGHDTGDRVLGEVAERLSQALGPGDLLGRFEAESFVVLSEGAPQAPEHVARRFEKCFAQSFAHADGEIVLKASMGIAVARDPSSASGSHLLREADSAMREARSVGRSWHVFDDALQARASRHLQVERALMQALERDEFVVHYQPQLEIASGAIVGAEALVRWQHPERGLVAPMEFIPIAEQTGQILAIGAKVLAEACRQAKAWNVSGGSIRISVNIAAEQLRRARFPADVAEAIARSGISAEQVCLEITESSLVRESDHGPSGIVAIKELGVLLSIDDFGTGYSSLSYLHHIPADELKIDRSFVSRLDREPRHRHLVEAIVGMARALELRVVAEGVETNEQRHFLAGLGCDVAQGFLFGPPVPADQFTALLAAQRSRVTAASVAR